MRKTMLASLAAAIVLPGSAQAQTARETAFFYNRPGVEIAKFETDLTACAEFGSTMAASPAGQSHGLVGAAFVAAMAGGNSASYTDDCMIARGYRRFDISSGETSRAFSARFLAMPETARLALIGAETPPEGVLVRRPSNTHWLARGGDPQTEMRAVSPKVVSDAPRITGLFIRGRENADLAPNADEAVILVSIRSPNGDLATVTFVRVDPEIGDIAPVSRGRSQRIPLFYVSTRSREAIAKAYVVPAGTYALTGSDMTTFCLGTFAFSAAPGAVVDVGAITVNEEPTVAVDPLAPIPTKQVRIDPGDSARAALSRAPELASRVEPARFFNGVVLACNNAFPSATAGVVMPGAPYLSSPDAHAQTE